MTHNPTKSQVLSVDAEMAIRQVIQNGVPCWQASSGRTFPQVAGAEDPPADTNTGDTGDDSDDESGDDFDKDRALKTIQKLRANEKAARERERAASKERDELRAKQKKADDEQLSETERLRARTAEQEAALAAKDRELQETRNRHEIERAAAKAGLADPEDAHSLLKAADFEHDDDGNIKNADKLVAALLKAKPYLAAKTTNGVPGTPRANGTQTHEERVKATTDILRGLPERQPL